ncbi:3-oxo-5-alpha-steroid 4-dehydrogenase 1 [Dendrobium catenatum]|uniref:Steroid 5-alpha-reductase DET2 n=1 Tax=Dendrobium catenatum TaxID=906689 RepID=A0A2I0WVE6_9ASPA|nr:3-oxo-5-alpha-steroid 4-dehydrogenase 1 [Dendrobium catenatum]PKU79624.1 Steroid 5-alpha-reductase DET2 [Dendrobium catenatum]
MSILNNFLFPPPPSIFVSAMSMISFTLLTISGLSEIFGRHLRYSKFGDAGGGRSRGFKPISSKAGMLFLYSPAMAYAVAAPFVFDGLVDGIRARLVAAALAIHFAKRVFEVLFIHQYSGQMGFDSTITISLSYFFSTLTTIYAQHLTQNLPEPTMDLKIAGVLLFLVGIFGNFHHHYLLSKLRVKGEKVYKIPKGGLFELVICPHYLFEIIGFIGICLISQTVYSFSFTFGTIIYLLGRSYVTRQWYLSKFDDFPRNVKALIPYVF